jgi:hypothetical protein
MIKIKINKKIISESKDISTLAKKLDKIIPTLDMDQIIDIAFNLASNPEIKSQLAEHVVMAEGSIMTLDEQTQPEDAPPGWGSYKEYTDGWPDPARLLTAHHYSSDFGTRKEIFKRHIVMFAALLGAPTAALIAFSAATGIESKLISMPAAMGFVFYVASVFQSLSELVHVGPGTLKNYWSRFRDLGSYSIHSIARERPKSQLAKDSAFYDDSVGNLIKIMRKASDSDMAGMLASMDRLIYFTKYQIRYLEDENSLVGGAEEQKNARGDLERMLRMRNRLQNEMDRRASSKPKTR